MKIFLFLTSFSITFLLCTPLSWKLTVAQCMEALNECNSRRTDGKTNSNITENTSLIFFESLVHTTRLREMNDGLIKDDDYNWNANTEYTLTSFQESIETMKTSLGARYKNTQTELERQKNELLICRNKQRSNRMKKSIGNTIRSIRTAVQIVSNGLIQYYTKRLSDIDTSPTTETITGDENSCYLLFLETEIEALFNDTMKLANDTQGLMTLWSSKESARRRDRSLVTIATNTTGDISVDTIVFSGIIVVMIIGLVFLGLLIVGEVFLGAVAVGILIAWYYVIQFLRDVFNVFPPTAAPAPKPTAPPKPTLKPTQTDAPVRTMRPRGGLFGPRPDRTPRPSEPQINEAVEPTFAPTVTEPPFYDSVEMPTILVPVQAPALLLETKPIFVSPTAPQTAPKATPKAAPKATPKAAPIGTQPVAPTATSIGAPKAAAKMVVSKPVPKNTPKAAPKASVTQPTVAMKSKQSTNKKSSSVSQPLDIVTSKEGNKKVKSDVIVAEMDTLLESQDVTIFLQQIEDAFDVLSKYNSGELYREVQCQVELFQCNYRSG